jgi:hypothetical protein
MLQEIIAEPQMRSLHNLNLYSEIFYSNVIVDAVYMFQNPLFIRTFSHLSYTTSHSEPLEIPTSLSPLFTLKDQVWVNHWTKNHIYCSRSKHN